MVGVHAVVWVVLACAAAGVEFGGPITLVIASVGMAVFGLPHGALDVALIRRGGERSTATLAAILLTYVGIGLAMAALWWIGPVVALIAFLGIAVVHFAEDWADAGSPFLATGLALAIVSAPAILHRVGVAAIFGALAGTSEAAALADVLLLVAPVGAAVAIAAIAALLAERRFDRAAAAVTSLAAVIILPPAPGFALFFALFHSPHHLAGAVRTLALPRARQWMPIALPTMLGAIGLLVLLYRLNEAIPSRAMGLTSATFMALSILTVPHMAVPGLWAMLQARKLRNPRLPLAPSRAR